MSRVARLLVVCGFFVITGTALGQSATSADCKDLGRRFERLIQLYLDAGSKAIADAGDVSVALERARQKAFAGNLPATVTMTGIALSMRGRADAYSVASVRQICTLADRTRLPLHLATCSYFTALNPLGERKDKRVLVERSIATFEALEQKAPPEAGHLPEDMAFLKTCLPPEA
ncbi:hypothetical protein MCEMSEM23_02395 [Rhabdaerophilaceae bacterium]